MVADQKVIKGGRRKRLLSEAIQLEEEVVPEFIRPAMLAIAVFVVVFIAWAATVNISEVASALGEVIPSGQVQVVEHLEGGVIEDILVEEGATVEKGQTLVHLNAVQANAEFKQLQARFISLRLRGERLTAFSEGRKPDFSEIGADYPQLVADQMGIYKNQIKSRETSVQVIKSQLEQRRRELRQLKESLVAARQHKQLTAEMLDMREKMVAKKLITRVEYLETKRAKITAAGEVARILDEIKVNEQAVIETQSRIADHGAQLLNTATKELGAVSAEIAEVRNSMARIEDRVAHLEIKAPIRGLVQELMVKTVGQVVSPGGLLMRIVPIGDTLEVEVQISPNDIGHIKIGQKVLVKVGSYDFSRFGGINGSLRRLSASSMIDATSGEAFFKGWVSLDKPHIGNEPGKYTVLPGMNVVAEISTGEKTLLQYIMKPLMDALRGSFRER